MYLSVLVPHFRSDIELGDWAPPKVNKRVRGSKRKDASSFGTRFLVMLSVAAAKREVPHPRTGCRTDQACHGAPVPARWRRS